MNPFQTVGHSFSGSLPSQFLIKWKAHCHQRTPYPWVLVMSLPFPLWSHPSQPYLGKRKFVEINWLRQDSNRLQRGSAWLIVIPGCYILKRETLKMCLIANYYFIRSELFLMTVFEKINSTIFELFEDLIDLPTTDTALRIGIGWKKRRQRDNNFEMQKMKPVCTIFSEPN